jgi:hypothetical protein
MEGTSQTGSSDIYGAGNNGRSFDFNVFPTEIFSALTVRKTPSADVEEGSLGATVDLSAPKPMDQKDDFVLSMTARGVYNELSKQVDPRASMLISKKFGDSGFGFNAHKSGMRLIRARTGQREKFDKNLLVEPGDETWVPEKEYRDWWALMTETIRSTAEALTLILLVRANIF